jgi:hypothetical protein
MLSIAEREAELWEQLADTNPAPRDAAAKQRRRIAGLRPLLTSHRLRDGRPRRAPAPGRPLRVAGVQIGGGLHHDSRSRPRTVRL